MKTLFITRNLPVNSGSGGSIRSHQIYRDLRKLSSVDVLCCNVMGLRHRDVVKFAREHNYLGNIRMRWDIPWYRRRQTPTKAFRQLLDDKQYDYIVVRYYSTMFWLGLTDEPNLILDCDDCALELQTQNYLAYRESNPLAAFRKIGLALFKKRYISDLAKVPIVAFSKRSNLLEWQDNFRLLPNKIAPLQSAYESQASDPTGFTVLFVGVLSYPPNYKGLDRFIGYVWPKVTRTHPHVTLKVVGQGLPPRYREKWKRVQGIRLCGYLESIEEVYADAHISISPVYEGSGTHIKVMESLIRRTPMVISKLAHRGYEDTLLDGESLYVASNDNEYAEKICRLIENPTLRARVAATGRDNVLTHHAIKEDENDILNLISSQKASPADNPAPHSNVIPHCQEGA